MTLGILLACLIAVVLHVAIGSVFALHVNSNFFWMFSTLLDLASKGSLKTPTMATSLGAVVSLPLGQPGGPGRPSSGPASEGTA